MAKIIEYTVTFRYSTEEPQQEEKFYTPGAARSKAMEVELWGGVSVITEEIVEDEGQVKYGTH